MKPANWLYPRVATACTVALFISIAIGPHAVASAAAPGPSFVYPTPGQTIDYGGPYLFKVNPISGASGYLYGFFQGGSMAWENYRDERELSGTEYAILPGSQGHDAIQPGALEVWARALISNQWTDATVIIISLDDQNASKPLPPRDVTTSFCFGPTLNLIWQDSAAASDSYRVYKDDEWVELTRGDERLHVSGPQYSYEVPPPIQDATLGVSAIEEGVESDIARPRHPKTFTC